MTLGDELRARFTTIVRPVMIGGRNIELLSPEAADELIDEDDFERDERLPYWADLWPSAQILAEEVSIMRLRGLSVLELGCGLGLVALAAAGAGGVVTATDYYEDALRFVEFNAESNGRSGVGTRMIDWNALPDDMGKFDVVLASDVLYEPRYATLVASVIARTLVRGGEAIVADPGRIAITSFCAECAELGLDTHPDVRKFDDGSVQQTITLWRVTWRH